MRTEVANGARYLQLGTALLQRSRLAAPTGGIWEAADVQWWSRQPDPSDPRDRLFWLDADGEPAAGVLRTDFEQFTQVDVIVLPGHDELARTAWQHAITTPAAPSALEFPVRADDAPGIAALTAAGYQPAPDGSIVSSWLPAADRPEIPALPRGFRLASRAEVPDAPHPFEVRNGPDVAKRLQRCSLYRPELDLCVRAPGGEVAGYGLFWADPVTRVGLVEPMRTEPAFQRRGIARHILATGLELLARHGCERLKVSNDIDLYLEAGFRPLPAATAASYVYPAHAGSHQ